MFSSTMPPEASVGIQRFSLLDALDRLLHLRGRHVVEQDGLGAALERLFELLRGAHLHLHALARLAPLERVREHRAQCRRPARCGCS